MFDAGSSHARDPVGMERYDANFVGGDINGGLADVTQLFFRPVAARDPYATAAPDVFLCSSSTPPGGGVHGMCGFWAARSALARVFGARRPDVRVTARRDVPEAGQSEPSSLSAG